MMKEAEYQLVLCDLPLTLSSSTTEFLDLQALDNEGL